jgi:hypothetical protein
MVVTVSKKVIEALGLEEPLDRRALLDYTRKFRIMPYWLENRGLTFRPHLGKSARQTFREILHLYTKEDVERLRVELRQPIVPKVNGPERNR